MGLKEMYDYLSNLTADYTTETLDISPQIKMYERGGKRQEVLKSDDPTSEVRITHSNTSEFYVDIDWHGLTPEDAGTIIDIFHNTSKADGISKSFYWTHPTDGHDYTVRFDSPVPRGIGPSWIHDIKNITLKILGRKP